MGEVRNSVDEKWDIHLKGSGRTHYSRIFDGRAVLRSTIREYLCSEAIHALGIPTTRALCIIGSDEKVEREATETGAMMLRMAETHVRFGSFEAFHYTDRPDYVKLLTDYVIEQNFPDKSNHRSNRVHLSNSNLYFSEKIDDLLDFYINHNEFELDVSPVILGKNRPLITRDRNLAYKVSKESGIPVTTVDLEFDTEYYITTRNLRDENIYNLQLWSRWLEIILKLKEKGNLERISIASNAPYNMSITDYPKVFEWLLNKESRKRYLSEFPSNLTENLKIIDITASLDFFDLCGLISTNPAKALGISEYKGHLGAGADADITLFKFDLNNSSINTSKFGEEISVAFSDSSIVIKNGKIIKKEGVIQSESENTPHGRIFWNQGKYDEELMKKVITSKESFYKKHFSLYLQNLKNLLTDNMENLKSD